MRSPPGRLRPVVLFLLCHNLAFNYAGFSSSRFHHRSGSALPGLPADGIRPPPTAGTDQPSLIRLSAGTLAAIAGLVVAASTARLRRMSVWLVVPAVSYYFGFIDVVLYATTDSSAICRSRVFRRARVRSPADIGRQAANVADPRDGRRLRLHAALRGAGRRPNGRRLAIRRSALAGGTCPPGRPDRTRLRSGIPPELRAFQAW
jgi:hypothetical protein